MKLQDDVTFDSLSAVRNELREWFGPDAQNRSPSRTRNATRDMLLSVIIHSLAEELSDVSARAKILDALEHLPQPDSRSLR